MGKDKSDYIAPLDSYNFTIVTAPIFLIFIVLTIVIGIKAGFNPIIYGYIAIFSFILVYMVVKNIVLVELELRKLRKRGRL